MKKGLIMEGGAMRGMFTAGVIDVMMENGNQKLLDGALADSIPVRFFESIGYDRNIAILTRPAGFRKKQDRLFPLMKLYYRKYPNLVQAIATRHEQYNDALDHISRQEQAGALLVLRPAETLPIGRTEKDPEKLRQIYEIGRKTAQERLGEIRQFLNGE